LEYFAVAINNQLGFRKMAGHNFGRPFWSASFRQSDYNLNQNESCQNRE
jgi:hypothetical protein